MLCLHEQYGMQTTVVMDEKHKSCCRGFCGSFYVFTGEYPDDYESQPVYVNCTADFPIPGKVEMDVDELESAEDNLEAFCLRSKEGI